MHSINYLRGMSEYKTKKGAFFHVLTKLPKTIWQPSCYVGHISGAMGSAD